MVLTTTSCTRPWTSLHSSSGMLSDLISWICLLFPLYNHKGFDLGHTDWPSDFPYCIQFKCEFCHKEFMIWATVSSWSCFCWLYRASPSSTAKNIVDLISALSLWWCPCVESSLVLLEEGVCYIQCVPWQFGSPLALVILKFQISYLTSFLKRPSLRVYYHTTATKKRHSSQYLSQK